MSAKVKFTISIKDLAISFEGDQATGRNVQQGIEETLTTIVQSPSRALGLESQVIEVPAEPVRPRRRRKAMTADTANGDGKGRKTNSVTCPSLIDGLITDGFFSTGRQVKDVKTQLAKSGHNFKQPVISMALLGICKKGSLHRDKNDKGIYLYKASKK